MKTMEIYFERGYLTLPLDALNECSHQGQCDEDVAHWVTRIDWDSQNMGPGAIRDELADYGAWDDDELADDEINRERILWIAAGNYQDENL